MSTPLHRLDSRYAYLTPGTIDFVLESVRDATEVLSDCELLPAQSMIIAARSVLETERLFEHDPRGMMEPSTTLRSDWTLACIAEGLEQAVPQLLARAATGGAAAVRKQLRETLDRIARSPVRSPLLSYTSVLSTLRHELRPAAIEERIDLTLRAIAEDLRTTEQPNVLQLLCELGESYLEVGPTDIGLHTLLRIARFDPTNILVHNYMAIALRPQFPELARAAAERALLLMPREDKHQLRPQLRAMLEQLRDRSPSTDVQSPLARGLLQELQSKPGKRSRSSLRSLVAELAPGLEKLPEKELEALPTPAGLAQLRKDLASLPRPEPKIARDQFPIPPAARREQTGRAAHDPTADPNGPHKPKVGRNDLCPCGSNKKWKRCCGARATC